VTIPGWNDFKLSAMNKNDVPQMMPGNTNSTQSFASNASRWVPSAAKELTPPSWYDEATVIANLCPHPDINSGQAPAYRLGDNDWVTGTSTRRKLAVVAAMALTLSVVVVGRTLRTDPARGDATEGIVGDRPNNASGKAGKKIGSFQIPTIDLDQPLYEGTNAATLKNGPGHSRTTPMPGKSGNVAIACHRTTFGAPCFRLDELKRATKDAQLSDVGDGA
jgi:Sortase domain